MLIDPLFATEVLFPDDLVVMPLTIVVDADGVIRHKWTEAGHAELVARARAVFEAR